MMSESLPVMRPLTAYLLGWVTLPVLLAIAFYEAGKEFWSDAWLLIRDVVRGELL